MKMTENNWLIDEIKQVASESTSYEEKAYFQELEKLVNEQYKRIEQAEGELDGSLWSPRKW